jgi:hypothetical protein
MQTARRVKGRYSGIGGVAVDEGVAVVGVVVVGVAVGWVGSAPVIWMRFEFLVWVKSSS